MMGQGGTQWDALSLVSDDGQPLLDVARGRRADRGALANQYGASRG
jgi:hypothetical protein